MGRRNCDRPCSSLRSPNGVNHSLLFNKGWADAAKFNALKAAMKNQGGVSGVVSPEVGGLSLSDGRAIAGDQMLKGGPSVLYDAVALLFGEGAGEALMGKPEARDFVADAFAHCKIIGFSPEALPLPDKAGIAGSIDEGMIELSNSENVLKFVSLLGQLRMWKREIQFFG